MTLDTRTAYIGHLPIGEALEAHAEGRPLPEFDIRAVDLEWGHAVGDALSVIADDHDYRGSFAPPTPPDTIEELRAEVSTWSDADRRGLREMLTSESVDRDDPVAVRDAMRRYHFHDVQTEAPVAAPETPVERPRLTLDPAEGEPVSDDEVDTIKEFYRRLDAASRSWVNQIAGEAKRAALSFRLDEAATSRRWHLMAALIMLAGDGFDNDDAVRGCLSGVLGAELTDSLAFNLGQLVGSCNVDEARRFHEVTMALADGHASMHFTDDNRCRVVAA